MSESIVGKKSFEFAVKIVSFYKKFSSEKKEFVMSKQILRSGTSVGANIREALNAQSRPDFIHKLSISQKECDETIYWLELLFATDYISKEEFESLKNPATEILKMIRSIIITIKNKNS
ncbi:four helix bundle protein [Chryseobacterium sp. Leaf201]|uniref:four helix bundle protein n=1 Tax=Chryseobacterium sp. Leaf201 TaxID=1735672 RepID=UPI0006FF007C|nr:four helix bundle protein [Chryseobacterium sp. Leaf201]KQM49947.1 four helix bundle protein [Chryseobacterium sp. Leaf201]